MTTTKLQGGRVVVVPRFELGPELETCDKQKSRLEELLDSTSGQSMSRYDYLRIAFEGIESPDDLVERFGEEGISELLRCAVGEPEIFVEDWRGMTEEERLTNFDNPLVATLMEAYAESASGGSDAT